MFIGNFFSLLVRFDSMSGKTQMGLKNISFFLFFSFSDSQWQKKTQLYFFLSSKNQTNQLLEIFSILFLAKEPTNERTNQQTIDRLKDGKRTRGKEIEPY